MAAGKIVVTIDEKLLKRLDRAIASRKFPNRSHAIQEALREKLDRLYQSRLAREAAKLDRAFERKLADEGLAGGCRSTAGDACHVRRNECHFTL